MTEETANPWCPGANPPVTPPGTRACICHVMAAGAVTHSPLPGVTRSFVRTESIVKSYSHFLWQLLTYCVLSAYAASESTMKRSQY